ncbi:protein FAM111A-like [Octodon degus]|uniref:Protein FAM111A-like n=1 Tax=Octodon degus TaxID=10160 RepID=A0A6P6DPA1_OCTDE|nr:protein FAM111A-like [Octodon degus]
MRFTESAPHRPAHCFLPPAVPGAALCPRSTAVRRARSGRPWLRASPSVTEASLSFSRAICFTSATMSSQKRRFQQRDLENNLRIEDFFPQVPKEEQNVTTISQKKIEYQKRVRNIKHAPDQGCHFPKKIPEDQSMHQNKIINVILKVNCRKNQDMKLVLHRSGQGTLQEALSTLEAVREEAKSQAGKEMLVCGTQGVEGFLNVRMPLSCLPKESTVKITFSNHVSGQENQVLGRQDRMSTDCVKFYIHAVGKTKKVIVKCGELHKKGNRLCVFGFKGETIKDAVCKDGRFLPLLENSSWRLVYNLDSIIESTQLVDQLEGKLFQIEVESRSGASVAATATAMATATATRSTESDKSSLHVLKEYIVEEYPSLKREREKFRENLKEEMKTTKKRKSALMALHKTNFGKQINSSVLAKTVKLLSRACECVGYLRWDNNGNVGSATCFVFAQSFVFTCQHVIRNMVGPGVEPRWWADIIGRCAWVTFSYEEFETKDHDRFDFEPWFEISDTTLDYAVLKLKENGRETPPGLYNGIALAPPNGLVHIIGHPEGESKRTDRCVVIPQSARGETSQRNDEGSVPEPDCGPSFVHMYSQNSFQEVLHNSDIITYDTTFYWGSSGSPVFDSNGSLVAMHTAGFMDEYRGRSVHVIEFGSAMRSILSHIEHKHKGWYEQVCAPQQEVEMLSQE